jgi:hypothetical protein
VYTVLNTTSPLTASAFKMRFAFLGLNSLDVFFRKELSGCRSFKNILSKSKSENVATSDIFIEDNKTFLFYILSRFHKARRARSILVTRFLVSKKLCLQKS